MGQDFEFDEEDDNDNGNAEALELSLSVEDFVLFFFLTTFFEIRISPCVALVRFVLTN